MPLSNKPLNHYASAGIKEVFDELCSSDNGISHSEAEKRLKEFGYNHIVEKKNLGVVIEFFSHFKNPLVIILIIASLVSEYFGQVFNAGIIGLMILLSVLLDFYLEHNAKKAAEKLREHVKTKVTVIRNGGKKEIKIEELCVGDVIFISAGNMIPADARVIESKDFFVNQASLTGESFPVEKTHGAIKQDHLSIIDLTNILFMGTSVISGSARAIIVKAGKHTEFGKIASKLVSGNVETEFDRGIARFGYLIMKATIFLVLFIFLFNSLMKRNVLESFLFSIAVAVGLTPELLPMIMSITMAQGSLRMAKKGVIVKNLSSISNFGSMDVLCTDKTGTLTEDKIKVVKYTDVFGKSFDKVLHYAYLNSFNHTGVRNPLDEAVLEFKDVDISGYRKIDEIPFDFARRRMSIVAEKSGKRMLITKGAPEEVFKSSKYYYSAGKRVKLDNAIIEKIRAQYYKFSMEGYRVLAVAIKEVGKNRTSYDKKDESGLEIIGFISFFDPAKQDVKEVLLELEKNGIEVKIVTGDNELVTKKICDDIGLKVKGVLLGNDVDSLSDEALKARVNDTTIFARFSPDQKNRAIRALKANGHVVGYLGDGINDAPSIKTADIGISVNSGADVAKETADIILTHKSLRVLREGVIDGRMTFGNTIKYIMMGLSSNFGNMFSVAVAVLFLPFLPMLPVQILLNNFIYDFSQITIPTDNVDREFKQKPKRWNMKFIKEFMFVFGPISSMFDIITFFILFVVFKVSPAMFQTGWFIESLATQTLVIHVIRTKRIPFLQSSPSPQLLISSIICVAFGWVLPYTKIGGFFGFSPLPSYILFSIVGVVAVYLITVEIAKRLFYKRHDF